MRKKKLRKFFSCIGNKLLSFLRVFSSVLFWFIVILAVKVIISDHHLRDLQYTKSDWWPDFYAIASGLLIGALVSFLFYFLVVFLPEHRKRKIIKSNLKRLYNNIKEDILYQIIFASQKGGRTDLHADRDTLDRLMTIEGFKKAFEGGREGHEGFYAFRNYIGANVPEYREINISLQILVKQIDYILHNYPIHDKKLFNFFKNIEMYLMRLEKIGPGHEEEKDLSRFIWEIFGGFNWIEGSRGHDIVEKMIDRI